MNLKDGIYNSSTKERLDKLEKSKEELEILIAKEKLSKPLLPGRRTPTTSSQAALP